MMIELPSGLCMNTKHVCTMGVLKQTSSSGACEFWIELSNGKEFWCKFKTVADAQRIRDAIFIGNQSG